MRKENGGASCGGAPARPTRTARALILLALTLCPPESLHAQGPLMQPSAVWAPASATLPTLFGDATAARPATYWATGAIIGGASLGLFWMATTSAWCGYDQPGDVDCTLSTIGGFLIGAAVGAGLGAFIGARFPKHPKPVDEGTQ